MATASVRRLFRSSDPLEDPWREPQELIVPEMVFGDARYALLLRDVGAALNLNEADEEMLRQFFAQGIGLDYADADELAQAILDWRDEDDLPRINGGEREEYLEEGALVLPPNRDFVDVDELRHVRGMTPEIYVAAAPHLTLIGDGQINLNSAPEPVLLALPGMDRGTVTQLLRLRESGVLPRSDTELRVLLQRLSDARHVAVAEDAETLVEGLGRVRREIEHGEFEFDDRLEDIHMHVEQALIDRLGDVGRKLHTARSRNDQVVTDLRLWSRDAIDVSFPFARPEVELFVQRLSGQYRRACGEQLVVTSLTRPIWW